MSRLGNKRHAGWLGLLFGLFLLAGCGDDGQWHAVDVSGASPDLKLTMTRANDGKVVTAADYRGKIALLYFGYTYCPDVCPTTLQNLSQILDDLGDKAKDIRVLFVSVDPNRDTLPILKEYAANFAPEIDALRGTPDQIASLARRFRVVYDVKPETKDHGYEVSHSSSLYVFDETGAARLLVPSLGTAAARPGDLIADLKHLMQREK